MGDEFETGEDEIFAAVQPRKMDKLTMFALWLQYRAHKKLVKADFYTAIASATLLHREYKVQRTQFQESASREIEALVTAVEGINGSAD